MPWTRLAIKVLILTVGIAFTAVFSINWCHMIYQCGCTFYWAGGAAQCNIHHATGPHCPWCSDATYGGIAFAFTLVVQTFVAFWPGTVYWRNLLLTLLASPLAAAVAGVGIGIHAGYWA